MSTLALARTLGVRAWPRARSAAIGPPDAPPVVAVLCDARVARAAAAAVALALARRDRRPLALAAAVAADGAWPGAVAAVPAAHRAVARLRERGQRATASGRLVWLGERGPAWTPAAGDPPGVTAAASAALGRAASAVRAPGALAIPLARTAALDRVLRWHDGIVIVRERDADDALLDCVRRSVAALGRPLAEMPCPARLPATAAALGIAAPVVALRAVAELGLGGEPDGGGS
jgi:hypothetical protein